MSAQIELTEDSPKDSLARQLHQWQTTREPVSVFFEPPDMAEFLSAVPDLGEPFGEN